MREAVLTGKLDPGEKIVKVKIAEELNVSRTPVREAIKMLELEELIEIYPQKGIFVAGIESKKIVRCHIENARKNVIKIFKEMTAEK